MNVIKKINNNVAICIDDHKQELIAFGKGIGFPNIPYDLKDLSVIDRTFYGTDAAYFNLLNEIPSDVFDVSASIIDYAKSKLEVELNPNLIFTLADHIQFAIQRFEKHMILRIPIGMDIQHLYEKEMQVGEKAVAYINKVKKICLSTDEAISIAMHFINAENWQKNDSELDHDAVIQYITSMIEQDFEFEINKESFNYSRFVSHMHYLLKRKEGNVSIVSENKRLFESMKEEYPKSYQCTLHLLTYCDEVLKWHPSEEEQLYLMLHMNRLCAREDCNR